MAEVLVDTNVALRLIARNDPRHPAAVSSVEGLIRAGHRPVLCPQVVVEAWVVLTRPIAVNGLGLDVALAEAALTVLMGSLTVLPDDPALFAAWWDLVRGGVRGKRAHDARLVAWMRTKQVHDLLTFNAADFVGFEGIVVRVPAVEPASP